MGGHTIDRINALGQEEFVRLIGPAFEHSPWIAEATWKRRPFRDLDELHEELSRTVAEAGEERQLALIREHPDLVGRAALARTLTEASSGEQASAGLDRLSDVEQSIFHSLNGAYREKFGFPFVICARLNKKDAILRAFPERLLHEPKEEIQTALEEIKKIAYLRLTDMVLEETGKKR
jgi:2-oxo-4-hydroxy-4-carboxy-5-ureidoimidazoline decarboxylase